MSQLISTLSVYSVQWAAVTKVQLGALWTPIACLTLLAAAGYWDLRRRIDRATDSNFETRAPETATA